MATDRPTRATRVLRFLMENESEDFTAAAVASGLGMQVTSVAVILNYMVALRPDVTQPERGRYRFTSTDDLGDVRLAVLDHATEIVRLLG